MALRTIRMSTDSILRKKSKEVKDINSRIIQLLDDMLETMADADGVGLAAPQVGVLRRIVIIDVGEGPIELINPEIVESSGQQKKHEGCLSIPGKNGVVKRPSYVKAKALNRNGEEFIVEGEGVKAIALSHEIDHLNGILYIDKLTDEPADDDEGDDENGEYDEYIEETEEQEI